MAYGVDQSRFRENKRAVEDKYLGALVKTSMNRCIQCTRCVRFATEVAGVPGTRRHRPRRGHGDHHLSRRGDDLRAAGQRRRSLPGRRAHLEALCVRGAPVGAQQDRVDRRDGRARLGDPHRHARTRGDAHPAAHQRRRERGMDFRQDPPRRRWAAHAAARSALSCASGGRLRPASWSEAFAAIAAKMARANPRRVGAIVGDLAAVEEIFALKDLMTRLGVVNLDCRQDGSALDPHGAARAICSIRPSPGSNAPTRCCSSAPIRAARRRCSTHASASTGAPSRNFPIGLIGAKAPLTYTYDYLGAGPETLADIGRHSFADAMRKAERPLIIVGADVFARPDGAAVASLAAKAAIDLGAIKDGWNGFSRPAHGGLARRRARSWFRARRRRPECAADGGGRHARSRLPARRRRDRHRAGRVRRLYRHPWRPRRARADVVLPGAAYPEKSAIYVNTEGRVQMATRASFPPGDAREDWAILRALSDVLGKKLPYDSLAQLRQALYKAHPHLHAASARSRRARRPILQKLAALGGNAGQGAVPRRASPTSISPIRSRAHPR